MMNQRTGRYRWLALLSVLVVLIPLLAACGGATEPAAESATTPEPSPATSEDNNETAISTPQSAAEPTEAPEMSDSTTAEPATDSDTASDTAADGPVPISHDGPYPLLHTPTLQFGAVAQLFHTDHERVLQLSRNAGFGWVRQQVHWKDIENMPIDGEKDFGWHDLDTVINAADAYDIKVMVSIVRAPAFYTADGSEGLPEDPAMLGDFVEAMALRYGDKIAAYEIWNEQNLAHETGGYITVEDAGHYVEILIECYNRIKAVNPNAYVIAGAPSPTNYSDPEIGVSDTEYLRAMYEYRDGIVDGHFDAQGVHPAGSANPPETLWPDNPSDAEGWNDHPSFYFRHIENIRDKMVEFGMEDHQIWITEFGWATENVTEGYEYGNQNTLEDQADYITRAIEMTYEEYPWVGNMFLWNMNFSVTWMQTDPPQPLHEQSSFSILNPDWSPRPAFDAIQGQLARLKEAQGR